MKKVKIGFILLVSIFLFVGCGNEEVKNDVDDSDSNVSDNNDSSSGEIVSDVVKPDENVQFVE